MKTFFIVSVALAAASLGGRAEAYPSFIGYGYTSCLTCHFNPFGNGPLTDYGRALSATLISAKPPFVGSYLTDEQLGESSGFAGRAKLPEWIRPSASYRGLLLASQLGKPASTQQWYNMQQEANVVAKFSDDKIYASLTLGYDPNPSIDSTAGSSDSHLVSREHYIGARLGDSWGLYAGFMDIAYGIRVPDHEAFSRADTNLAENDQTHGVLVHYTTEKMDLGLHAFLGNLYQSADKRPKGVSATGEYELWDKGRLGASVLHSDSDYRSRWMEAVHVRTRLWKEGQALLAEWGWIHENTALPSSNLSEYLFVQSMHRLFRGFHILGNAEYYSGSSYQPGRSYRLGPAMQWFPEQRLELRADLTAQVDATPGGPTTTSYNWMGQVHLSF